MDWQYRLFIVLAPLSAVVSVATLLYARGFPRPVTRDTFGLSWLVAFLVGWLTLNTCELIAPSPAATLFWAKMTYVFIGATPVAWLVFAARYTGRQDWVTPIHLAWLCAIPVFIGALALTNDWHSLVWESYEFLPVPGGLTMRVVAYGPGFWINMVYGYGMVIAGAVLIGRQHLTSFRLYRHQSRLMVIGVLIPIAANMIYLFHLVPGLRKDYTAISFALASIVFGIGIHRYGLFDLKPIARHVVVDNLDAAVLVVDLQGRIVDLNHAATLLISALGPAGAEARPIGQQIDRVCQTWPALCKHVPARHETCVPVDIVVDGRQRFYDLHTLPLSDPRGCPAGQLLVLHDITVHKEAEARLQCHARELETRNQELDAFARTVAHDLKNPLSVLLSYSQLLTDQADKMSTTQLRVFLDGIARTSEEMAHIVEELLLLARVRRSERIAIAPLCMERITGRAVDRLEQSIVRAGAELIMPEAWPVAVGYAPWVEEVWANYISNAVKYGGRRQAGVAPRIELGAGGHDATPTSHVRFWVRDNGPGLTHAEQARLFVEFTRLGDAVQRDEGYGLGLSIVRRIVEKLGGEVGVESEPGQGSTFWFTLPRRAIVTDARP